MEKPPQPYFASLAIRKTLLRIVVASGLPALAINIFTGVTILDPFSDYFIGIKLPYPDTDPRMTEDQLDTDLRFLTCIGVFFIVASVLVSSVLLHHVLRLWPRKIWTVRSEFIYSIVELIFVTGYLIFEIFARPLILGNPVVGIMDAILLWLSIVALFVIMVWDLRLSKYRTMRSTYNFMESYDDVVSSWRRLGIGRWSLLFGENVFRRRFGMDRVFVRALRAGISVLCVFAMVALAIRVVILRPIQQEPVFKSVLTQSPKNYVVLDNTTMRLRVIRSNLNAWEQPLFLGIRYVSIEWQPESQLARCYGDKSHQLICNVPSPFSEFAPEYLIIKINYASAPGASPRTGVYLDFSSLPTELLYTATEPIPLYPGLHLFGVTSYSFKDTFASTSDHALGIPRYNHKLVAKIQALFPDPEFTSLSPDNNTTGTLKLTYQDGDFATQWAYEVQQEQSTDTVLSGFAVLGGAWTFISGVFAMVFGCKLLLVLFGIKPLSIYGLIHVFQGRRSLADDGYILSAEEQNRTIAVLRAHLLDDDDVEANGPNKECDLDEERSRLNQSTAA